MNSWSAHCAQSGGLITSFMWPFFWKGIELASFRRPVSGGSLAGRVRMLATPHPNGSDRPSYRSADDLQLPSGTDFNHSARCVHYCCHMALVAHHTRSLHGKTMHRYDEEQAQRLEGSRHGLQIETSVMKHAFAKARDFAS